MYLVCVGASTVLWAVSIAVPASGRYWLWAIAVLVDAVGPGLATLRNDRLPLHIEHLAERFGLLVILVLGEALGGAARGIHDAGWAGPSIVAGILGLLLAAGLWWAYFDVVAATTSSGLKQASEEGEEDKEPDDDESPPDADQRHDLFVYGHFPLALGTILAGVGMEGLAAHPETSGPSAAAWILAGGLALFYAGNAMIVAGTALSWRPVWPWPLILLPVVVALGAAPMPRPPAHRRLRHHHHRRCCARHSRRPEAAGRAQGRLTNPRAPRRIGLVRRPTRTRREPTTAARGEAREAHARG